MDLTFTCRLNALPEIDESEEPSEHFPQFLAQPSEYRQAQSEQNSAVLHLLQFHEQKKSSSQLKWFHIEICLNKFHKINVKTNLQAEQITLADGS